jgi:hypothetical protein
VIIFALCAGDEQCDCYYCQGGEGYSFHGEKDL